MQARGHIVRLLLVQHVKRFRLHHRKTDRIDAAAMLKADEDETIHSVPIKSVDDQTLQRTRSGGGKERTARINQVRRLRREFGIIAPTGANALVTQLPALIEAHN